MVGATAGDVPWSTIKAANAGCNFCSDDPFVLDPVTGVYVAATSFTPTFAYWVCVLPGCEFTVSNVAAKMTTPSVGAGHGVQSKPMTWSSDLEIRNGDQSVNLKIGSAVDAANEFDVGLDRPVPPAPPMVKFDAWLEGVSNPFNRLADDIRGADLTNTWTVKVKSDTEFTLSWAKEALPNGYSFVLRANGDEIDMKETESYSVRSTNGNVMNFEVVVTELPDVFALSQNSPNPFGEFTSIEFQLPKDSRVNVSVYSITGQKLAELADKDMKAGYHTVNWDGRDASGSKLSTGIYFYVLQTEEFRSVKKMTILR
jgi:hypothetical protein